MLHPPSVVEDDETVDAHGGQKQRSIDRLITDSHPLHRAAKPSQVPSSKLLLVVLLWKSLVLLTRQFYRFMGTPMTNPSTPPSGW